MEGTLNRKRWQGPMLLNVHGDFSNLNLHLSDNQCLPSLVRDVRGVPLTIHVSSVSAIKSLNEGDECGRF